MTYGQWLDEAHTRLRQAAATMPDSAGPAGMGDLLAALTARQTVYSALARHVELLAGGRPGPVDLSPEAARMVLDRGGQHLTRLYVGLRVAALHQEIYPVAEPSSAPAMALCRAADAVAVAADLLAGHVQPGERPRTAEGAAIRDGGGVQAGIGDVARLTHTALLVDAALPQWIRADGRSHADTAGPAIGAARWAISVRLSLVARDLIAAAAGQVPLLRLLDTAPATGQPVSAVDSGADAASMLVAARDWLWQNPTQIHATHLRAGTQVGLAVSLLGESTVDGQSGGVEVWRTAAMAAVDLYGSPPEAEARHTADALTEVLGWARRDGQAQAGAMRRICADLPVLAASLYAGVARAVGRGELFVHQTELRRPERGLIFYATPVWRRAGMGHDSVRTLSDALRSLAPAETVAALGLLPGRVSGARRAFAGPPRPQPNAVAHPAPAVGAAASPGSRPAPTR